VRSFLVFVLSAVMLVSIAQPGWAQPAPDSETHDLKQEQRAQRKQLKQQQHETLARMNQRPTSRAEKKRFKHDMKVQRQLLKKSQKADRVTAKQNRENAKRSHTSRAVL
jgi:hypothetical protein